MAPSSPDRTTLEHAYYAHWATRTAKPYGSSRTEPSAKLNSFADVVLGPRVLG